MSLRLWCRVISNVIPSALCSSATSGYRPAVCRRRSSCTLGWDGQGRHPGDSRRQRCAECGLHGICRHTACRRLMRLLCRVSLSLPEQSLPLSVLTAEMHPRERIRQSQGAQRPIDRARTTQHCSQQACVKRSDVCIVIQRCCVCHSTRAVSGLMRPKHFSVSGILRAMEQCCKAAVPVKAWRAAQTCCASGCDHHRSDPH